MKTLTTILITLFLSFSLTGNNNPISPTHGGEIDIAKSSIAWVGKKVTGQHEGHISLKSGKLLFENHQLTGGSFEIDMTSIVCTDIKGNGAVKLVGHLNSEDFFSVADFPSAKLNLTKVEAGEIENEYKLTADLTIKGITHPISFVALITKKTATADLMIDRTAYGIKYGSGSFFDNLGDKAIDNEFKLSVMLVLK